MQKHQNTQLAGCRFSVIPMIYAYKVTNYYFVCNYKKH
jgi:hypothetical protein